MIKRQIATELHALLGEYPIVTVLGPRQSGKTTLVKSELPGWAYCNLESPDVRQFATEDPRAFLGGFGGNVILDEIQRVPELLSYIQSDVDATPGNGRYVLTGSHQLALHQAITQSLAGRTAILRLYPFSIAELKGAGVTAPGFAEWIHRGFLPRIHDRGQRPYQAYSNYFQTYVERDVRQIANLRDFALFEKFMRLLAGRAGQLIDYTSIANDLGTSVNTVKAWLSVLEASFIVFRLPPYFESFGKRSVKAPKYYFVEPGLLAFLLGIETPAQLRRDPLVGSLFENLVVVECLKERANRAQPTELWFFRDSHGNEVDLLCPRAGQLHAIEIKSASTYSASFLKGLRRARTLSPSIARAWLVYSGEPMQFSDGIEALRYDEVSRVFASEPS